MGIQRLLLCVVAIAAVGIFFSRPAAAEEPVKVLLVTGVDYPGHKWQETAPVVEALLEKDPRIVVDRVDDPEVLGTDRIFEYDVLLLHFKNYDPLKNIEQVKTNLRKFVEQGGGMMMTHFACGALPEWPEFVELAGRIWFGDVCPPGRAQHDPFRTFEVRIADREHPITKTMENFEVPDELYTCLTGETPIHVIATAKSNRDGKDYPMAFVLQVGKGRVFHSVLGHDTRCYETPGVQTLMQRACLWTAGREP